MLRDIGGACDAVRPGAKCRRSGITVHVTVSRAACAPAQRLSLLLQARKALLVERLHDFVQARTQAAAHVVDGGLPLGTLFRDRGIDTGHGLHQARYILTARRLDVAKPDLSAFEPGIEVAAQRMLRLHTLPRFRLKLLL